MNIESILSGSRPPDVRELSALSLAFLGDSVYEQFIRTKIIASGNRPAHTLHKIAVGFVKAKAQALAMEALLPELSEAETAIYKRGRNTNIHTVPKNAEMNDYRQATGLECLVGFLYLTGQTERLLSLLEKAYTFLNKE